jgi:hypothetical protein
VHCRIRRRELGKVVGLHLVRVFVMELRS